jgi:ATP-binding cassette, subfamily C, bacterial CydD
MLKSFPLIAFARPHRHRMLLIALANLLTGASILGQAYSLSLTLAGVFLDNLTLLNVRPALAGFAAFSLLRGLLAFRSEQAALRFAARVKRDLREDVLARLAAFGPVYTSTQRSGELVNTLTDGLDAVESYFSQFLPQLSRAALIPTGIMFVVFTQDFISGMILLLTAPLIPLFMILIGNLAEGITRRQWRTMSRLSAHFLDVLQGLTTLKIFNRSRDQISTIRQISHQYRETTMGVLRIAFLSALVLEMLATISTALVAVQIGLRLLSGRFELQPAFFILFLAPEFYQPLRKLGSSFHTGSAGQAAAARIVEVLERQPLPRVNGRKTVAPGPIRFVDVSCVYDGRRSAALDRVSFTLHPGTTTALIGPSGSGKTTITRLLLGFLPVDSGEILAAETPLPELTLHEWRQQTAWVPQSPYLFQGSIAENIRLAMPDASMRQVRKAAEQAHALDFICRLPDGFDTLIGEQGARLSGGQAQRIALARAFLKDSAFIILDEPTAHLDPELEAELQPVFTDLALNKTTLLITHRLHTTLPVNQVVVLQGGRVVEAGSPAQLQEAGGLYARMHAESQEAAA